MIKSCKNCNRAFGYNGGPVMLCSKCDEMLWGKVKSYLREHPNALGEEVSRETKVKLDIIKAFIADDRLKANDVINNQEIVFNKCQTCGAIIDDGNQYCSSCLEKEKQIKMLNEMKSMYKPEKRQEISINVNSGSRMYTTENNRSRRR